MISSERHTMTRHQKKMLKLLKNPRPLRLNEFKPILASYGYILQHAKGSHFKFTKPGSPSITVPVHHNKIDKLYIKQNFKFLLFNTLI